MHTEDFQKVFYAVSQSLVLVLQLTARHAQNLIFLSFLKRFMDAKLIKNSNSKSRGYRIKPIIQNMFGYCKPFFIH